MSAFRFRHLLAVLVIGVATIGCMDFAGYFSSVVVNESSEALIVRYTPSDPDLEVRSFTVEPHQSGQGLGARLSAYRAGSITVLTTGCSPFGTVPLDREKIDLRISPSLSVERLGDDDVPALAKSTYLDELSGDAACDQANPTPTG